MTRHEAITLALSPERKARLEELALTMGATWGDRANISALVRMIADGRIILHKPGNPITGGDRDYYRGQLSDLEATLANLRELAP